jgi:hypothetical protein
LVQKHRALYGVSTSSNTPGGSRQLSGAEISVSQWERADVCLDGVSRGVGEEGKEGRGETYGAFSVVAG